MTDMSDADDLTGQKRNIIITYAKLEELVKGLLRVEGKVDTLTEKAEDDRRTQADHEVRIRSLELSLAGVIASRNTGFTSMQWVWTLLYGAAIFGLGVLSYFK